MPRNVTPDEHVLPRPVTRLPEYARADARKNTASKLIEKFGLSDEAARTFADAAVDPAELRKAAEAPEEILVPGGSLFAIRTRAWSERLFPDPRNPRIGPSRRHPFAVEPGTAEDSRFRPVPDPLGVNGTPELEVTIENREHLTWASAQAKAHVLRVNDWRASIRSQGVMTEVWVAATHYRHMDGTPDVCALTTVEGSSRTTAVHEIFEKRSADVMYDLSDRTLRSSVEKLNAALERGASAEECVTLRCATMPVLFLVGFKPHAGGSDDFHTAVRSLVALRHVEPPEPWGEGPAMEALADGVLDELERKGIITAPQRRWYAGSFTKDEARAAHLSADPAVRATAIIRLFTTDDDDTRQAIRRAVTAQSTRRRINRPLLHALATALIMRSVAVGGDQADRIRRYMQEGFAGALHSGAWDATTRSVPDLVADAQSELASEPDGGPVGLELAARATYPLITTLRLHADRGTQNNDQPDRRKPGEVIDALRHTTKGIHQLGQALTDHAAGRSIRAVGDDGTVLQTEDGSTEREVSDRYMRNTWPKSGAPTHVASPETSQEKLQNALADFGGIITKLVEASEAVAKVTGTDDHPLVEVEGVAPAHCKEWRRVLSDIEDSLILWGATHKRRFGSGAPTAVTASEETDPGGDETREPEEAA